MRRAHAVANPGMSLFPFLAVLLCTMGALIVLLVVIARQSRLEAATVAPPLEDTASDEVEREAIAWRIEMLSEARKKTEADLRQERIRLAVIEDHMRRLEQRKAELKQSVGNLSRLEVDQAMQQDTLAQEIERLAAEIAAARANLEQAKQDQKQRQGTFAVVPYRGPNGTQRRPLYVECLRDRVVLRPENIVFSVGDFKGDLGPGNPLASSLRAARDYLAEQSRATGKSDGDPYPLVLVRPDGIVAYNAVRASLSSWGSEFGYEFVDADWELQYPPIDPELARVEQAAADAARMRQIDRPIAASGVYARRARPLYRASASGGVVHEGGSEGSSLGGGSSDEVDSTMRDWNSGPESSASSGEGSGTESRTGTADGQSSPWSDRRGERPIYRASPLGGITQESGPRGLPSSANRSLDNASNASSNTRSGSQATSGQRGQTGGEPNSPLVAPQAGATSGRTAQQSMANKRGKNWGLPNEAVRKTPVTRPIRIQCRAEQFILLPERGAAGGQSVAIPVRTEDAVDDLLTSIWKVTEGWGIAGNDMYWKPTLVLETGSGGEGRVADLETLMTDSGLEVKRVQ